MLCLKIPNEKTRVLLMPIVFPHPSKPHCSAILIFSLIPR